MAESADKSPDVNRDEGRIAPQSLPRNVKVLGWASCLNDVASEMIFPLLPQFLLTVVVGGNRFYLGLIEGIADSASSLLKPWFGAMSDRAPRRKGFVLFGYALAAVARPILAVVWFPWQVLLVRSADRVGKGVRTAPRDALLADSTSANMHGRAFGFHRGMDHLGAAIGPLLATAFLLLWPGQLRWLFALTIVPGMAVVLLVALGLRERAKTRVEEAEKESGLSEGRPQTGGQAHFAPRTAQSEPVPQPSEPVPHQGSPVPDGRQPARASMSPSFRLYLAALLVFTLGNSSDAFLLVRAGELGVGVAFLPLLWFVFHVVKSIGNVLAGRWVDRVGPWAPILLGWLLYAGVYLAFALAAYAWQAWALFIAYGVFYALSEPAERTLVARMAPEGRKGSAFGWFNLAIGVSALPASLIFGLLYQTKTWGAPLAFGWGAAMALVAVGLLIGVRVPAARYSVGSTT
jgi:MFS family permease